MRVPTFLLSLFWLALFAVLPFCLSSKHEARLSLGNINEPGRIAFAARTLGHKGFHKIANLKPDHGALEKFIYSKVQKSLKNAPGVDLQDFTNTIISESNEAGIDPIFVLSVIQHESRFNNIIVGTHGEIGLMQVMPATARWLADENGIIYHDTNDLYDPIINIRLGISYISWLRHKFPTTRDLTSAYNMGPKHLRKAVSEDRRPKDYYTKVMKNYVNIYAEAQYQILATSGASSSVVAGNEDHLLPLPDADNN